MRRSVAPFVVVPLLLSSTAFADPAAEARALLSAGKAKEAHDKMKDVPGLHGLKGEALEALNDVKGACALYEADAETFTAGKEGIQLRRMRCAKAQGDTTKVLQLTQEVLTTLTDPLLLKDGFAAALKADPKAAMAWLAKQPKLLRLDAPRRDRRRREALADFYFAALEAATKADVKDLADKEALIEKTSTRLYEDLGDTEAGVKLFHRKPLRALRAHKDKGKALRRARVLVQQHKNKDVLATLKRHMPKVKDKSGEACEIRYLVGKTERKMRRYKASRRHLDFVAKRCTTEHQRKARYLQARVASYQRSKETLKLVDAFVKDFPDDKLTDDVMLWKAEFHAHRNQHQQAIAAYQKLIATFPHGDMHQKARFDLAMLQARQNKTADARKTLQALAQATVEGPVLLHDQAQYWDARLAAFPNMKNAKLGKDKALVDEGLAGLQKLAMHRPASYYGHLARLMRLEAAELRSDDVKALQTELAKALVFKRAADVKRANVDGFPMLLAARALLNEGYDAEAVLFLDAQADAPSYTTLDDAVALELARLYADAGHPEKSHQVLRGRGLALIDGHPKDKLDTWLLAYPKAHQAAIDAATAKVKLPAHILFGLAREESAFDADVLSWAGAMGLTQLMPPTAREEAKLLRLPEPSVKDVLQPELNARLGARHLSRRLSLGHPLLAIAAYNAGPGNVRKWTKGERSSKAIDALVEGITIEQTRRYVKKVTGSWVAYALLYGDLEEEAQFDVLVARARLRSDIKKNAAEISRKAIEERRKRGQ